MNIDVMKLNLTTRATRLVLVTHKEWLATLFIGWADRASAYNRRPRGLRLSTSLTNRDGSRYRRKVWR